MKRIHYLAAEIFGYSYANYENHLGINDRFNQLMPQQASILEKSVKENWSTEKVAQELNMTQEEAQEYLQTAAIAISIVDAENPVESFQISTKEYLRKLLQEKNVSFDNRLLDEVIRGISYRVLDLGYILEQKGHSVSQYSQHLRNRL